MLSRVRPGDVLIPAPLSGFLDSSMGSRRSQCPQTAQVEPELTDQEGRILLDRLNFGESDRQFQHGAVLDIL